MLKRIIIGCALILMLASLAGTASARELLVCGADEVYALNVDGAKPVKVWRWKAKARAEMPRHIRKRFGSTDDCKPVDGGTKVLITSSGGGTALVDRRTGRALFWALTPYAHSAEMLPGNRIVVACSAKGNYLVVFDAGVPENELFRVSPLPGAHGVVWDGKRQLLWAVSDFELGAYRLGDWDTDHPSLSLVDSYKLPKTGGHDLQPVPGSDDLAVTANAQAWYFDRKQREFRAMSELCKPWAIKSISIDPFTHELAYVQAEGRNWWAERIHILPDKTIHLPGTRIYKARWNVRK